MKSQENNCRVLQLGNESEDHSHVSKITPQKLKKPEFEASRYETDLNAGFDVERQKATTRARRSGNVRPLGGS
jgi:hypothetical protein